ncbi:uncharacterized protein LOC143891728 [Tasmannia lanceolata]|uniref:uncharacterized protein LOC143891728 n=1 Tax=Tasmannia lanceolata TaxID=3420 RepID=UPI004064AEC8
MSRPSSPGILPIVQLQQASKASQGILPFQTMLMMIGLGAWNVRRLGTSTKRDNIKNIISKEKMPIMCLIETRATQDKLRDYVSSICADWQLVANYTNSDNGRIWIIWDPLLVSFNFLQESSQLIHGEVLFLQSSHKFMLTAIYTHNTGRDRKMLSSDPCLIAAGISIPRITIGDFNTTRSSDERVGGAPPIWMDLVDFNKCILDCSLYEIRSLGQHLSWCRRAENEEVKLRRLDRALVNHHGSINLPTLLLGTCSQIFLITPR